MGVWAEGRDTHLSLNGHRKEFAEVVVFGDFAPQAVLHVGEFFHGLPSDFVVRVCVIGTASTSSN